MKLDIIAIGKKMPAWCDAGYQEYAKRFPTNFSLHCQALALEKRHKNSNIDKIKQKEAELILGATKPDSLIIALDEHGKQWDTQCLAKQLEQWQQQASTVHFLIGGPDGLDQSCLTKANATWSLSKLTLPHPLVRVVLAEQLYRAITVLQNHPYHRE